MANKTSTPGDIDIDPAIRALWPNYIRRRHSDIAAITVLLGECNFAEIRRLGHNMRGSGGAYGLPIITEIGRDLEEAAQQADVKKLEKLNKQLSMVVAQIKV